MFPEKKDGGWTGMSSAVQFTRLLDTRSIPSPDNSYSQDGIAPCRLRIPSKPTPAKPISIMAQVDSFRYCRSGSRSKAITAVIEIRKCAHTNIDLIAGSGVEA